MNTPIVFLVIGICLILWHLFTDRDGELTFYSGWISIIIGMGLLARYFMPLFGW